MITTGTLNPSQIMVLQSFATIDNKQDEEELRELLKSFYAKKLDEEMQRGSKCQTP